MNVTSLVINLCVYIDRKNTITKKEIAEKI